MPARCGDGASGMPDAIRTTVEGFGARPQNMTRLGALLSHEFGHLAATVGTLLALPTFAYAQGTSGPVQRSTLDAYMSAFGLLDRHEIAALALTLGILCFAVVTAILLVRTRRRLADVEIAARDESIVAKAAIDRAYALLLSEPQIL